MNLELLKIEVPEVEKPGLEIFDPRFDDIVGFIDKAEYMEAAQSVQAVIEEGIYDIRVIGYFLYGVFLEGGPATFGELSETLCNFLNDNFEKVGPSKNRQKQAQSSLRWFLAQIIKKMEYEEKRNSSDWQSWQQSSNTDQIDSAIENTDKLRRSLTANLEEHAGPLVELTSKISAIFSSFRELAQPVLEESEAVIEELKTEDVVHEEQLPNSQVSSGQSFEPGSLVNAPLTELTLKIEAFKQLCKEGDFTRASIVSEDLEENINNFTPQDYFPQSFALYFATLAANSSELSSHWKERGSLSWKALDKLYQIDPESFLNLEI